MLENKYSGGVAARSSNYWKYVAETLLKKREEFGGWSSLAAQLNTSVDAYRKFATGCAKALTESSLRVLIEKMWVTEDCPAQEAEPDPATATSFPPMAEWLGETKSTSDAAADKGVSADTIRKWCKSGKLDYVRVGRRIFVAINEKYSAVAETELARLRKENAVLKADNAALTEQVQSLQLKFNFDVPDTDAAAVIGDYARTITAQAERIAELRKLVPTQMKKFVPLLTDGRQTLFGRV